MLEAALWTALESLEEARQMAQRLRERALERGRSRSAKLFEQQERELMDRSQLIHRALVSGTLALTPRHAEL
jgi:hypothetical protein